MQSSNSNASMLPIDLRLIATRHGCDAQFAAKIVALFRAGVSAEMKRLTDALATADCDGFRRAAHTVKTMAAYTALDDAVKVCQNLEDLAKANRLNEVRSPLAILHQRIDGVLAWIAIHDTDRQTNAA